MGLKRHRYGDGPFARLRMPQLPESPGLYVWAYEDEALLAGKADKSLRERLGSRGYATISTYNTYARRTPRGWSHAELVVQDN